jgi:hypothetical protein
VGIGPLTTGDEVVAMGDWVSALGTTRTTLTGGM